ncbi:hypothetical protein [Mycolicibacterium sp. CR10]|uniref:zinc finger domain-containing protein n=1 Tax=Mycolicibacterium sp. CR10 TaxID=2562314 RepID=UPI0014850122|nr:hypothetical protein [Mycolicibacterium sp. CR10]
MTTTVSPSAYDVACPICAAEAGQPCENVVGGWIRPADRPHLYRVQVADEVTR